MKMVQLRDPGIALDTSDAGACDNWFRTILFDFGRIWDVIARPEVEGLLFVWGLLQSAIGKNPKSMTIANLWPCLRRFNVAGYFVR
jgi:hypothetical protein